MATNFAKVSVVLALVLSATMAIAQTHYVVVGAYAVKKNVNKAIRYAREMGFEPTYEYVSCRKLYYVYTFRAPDRDEGLEYIALNRVRDVFPDTWLFHGTFDCKSAPAAASDSRADEMPAVTTAEPPQKESEAATPQHEPLVVFKLYDQLARLVDGKVTVADAASEKLQGTFSANQPTPINITRDVKLTTKVIGYRTLITNYRPSRSNTDVQEIPLHLQPLKKGDFIELPSIRFQPNSALLSIESKEDLVSLASYLKRNGSVEIRLHGHTNDKRRLTATLPGKSSNLFEADKRNTRQRLSAKSFSRARAETVKSFLASMGVSSSRMTTQGWGASKPIFAKDDKEADLNDRIEVELTRD